MSSSKPPNLPKIRLKKIPFNLNSSPPSPSEFQKAKVLNKGDKGTRLKIPLVDRFR